MTKKVNLKMANPLDRKKYEESLKKKPAKKVENEKEK